MLWPRLVGVVVVVTAGCALPQSEECRAYVACQNAYDKSVKTDAYEPAGECWATPQAAQQCTDQCKVALDALRDVPDPPKECRSP